MKRWKMSLMNPRKCGAPELPPFIIIRTHLLSLLIQQANMGEQCEKICHLVKFYLPSMTLWGLIYLGSIWQNIEPNRYFVDIFTWLGKFSLLYLAKWCNHLVTLHWDNTLTYTCHVIDSLRTCKYFYALALLPGRKVQIIWG